MGRPGLKHLFVFSLLLFLFSWYKYSNNYKLVSDTLPATHAAPQQAPLDGPAAPQSCCKGKYCWTFTPLQNYSAAGLVFGVSHKLASDFDDVMAADAGLLWGENSARELYKDVKLRVMFDHYDARWDYGVKFNLHEAANTHLASCDADAFAAAKKIRPGDQVRLKGWLVNATASEKPGETDPYKQLNWKSSLSRTDKGEGACELLYLRSPADIEILERGPRRWFWLKWLGLAGMLLALAQGHRNIKRQLAEAQKTDW